MVLPLAVVGFFTVMVVLTAIGPRALARRIGDHDQHSLDDTYRSFRRTHAPTVPVAAAIITATLAVTSFAEDDGAWPLWILAAAVALVQLGVQRASRTQVLRLLDEAGARPPSGAVADHDRRQRRWSDAGAALFTAGTCCRVLARIETLSVLVVPGAALILAAFAVIAVVGWRGMRGPDPEPLVPRRRDG